MGAQSGALDVATYHGIQLVISQEEDQPLPAFAIAIPTRVPGTKIPRTANEVSPQESYDLSERVDVQVIRARKADSPTD